MGAFIIRRLIWLPVVLFFVSVITLALGLYGPGNPVQVMMGLHTNPETVARIKAEYGLDEPLYRQYLNYVGNALQGNFGYGLVKYKDQPVGRLIAERLPITIQLNLMALILGTAIGIPLGLISGIKRNTWFDFAARLLSLVAVSLPLLFLLPVLTFVFSRRHDLFISGFDFSLGPLLPMIGGRWEGILSTKIILPVFIESLGFIAILTRQMRAGMIEVLGQDYVRTARAKGLRERAVIARHAMRNALIPIATILGLSLGGLVEGSFLVENWFGIPGVGQLAFDAFASREYYVIIGLVLLIAVAYVVANMFVDFLYPILDPRIRRS
ncbi:Dipeptide transport system permease protein DppB [Anaerolineae bacterium]|nr:Dipeptide transport system permease protein DppB [Anaerolineae bacterium]